MSISNSKGYFERCTLEKANQFSECIVFEDETIIPVDLSYFMFPMLHERFFLDRFVARFAKDYEFLFL